MITHDAEVAELSDRVYRLRDGRIIEARAGRSPVLEAATR
jgi:ABC-type lipoprotein export system ATPase subunit